MPFDGTASDHAFDALDAVEAMIQFYQRPMSWCTGTLYMGDPRDPSVACLRGALNYVTFGQPKRGLNLLHHPRRKVWRTVNTAMRRAAKQKYNKSDYIYANDKKFKSRIDALDLLTIVRSRLTKQLVGA
jgi:hypothetical protein